LKGKRLNVVFTVAWRGERCERALISILDISKQKAAQHRFESLTRTGRVLSSDLDLERIVQSLTDTATELSGAKFGAFFHNVTDEQGERYVLYTLSGAPREAFSKFGLPRNTAVFEHTFRGAGIVRSDDITKDPRYGHSAPHYGMPKGHLPVVSYLAVPVISRSGQVLGGLFLGHDRRGVFTQHVEEIVAGIAAQAAVAIDNGQLLQSATREVARRRASEATAQRLAAIVESSDDAIVSKDLDGIIQSWNKGAERVFGWTSQEIIGKPVTILFPPDRYDEEPEILARIRQGERVDHYETVRKKKDGSLIDVSLTVSPVRDENGTIIAASKIARDVSGRKRAERQRDLLMAELSHRVKNTLAMVISIERLSFAKADDFASARQTFSARIQALAHAHGQLAESNWASVSLSALLEDSLAPFADDEKQNIVLSENTVALSPHCSLSLGLAIHELATNAAKYGALSTPMGRLSVTWSVDPQSRDLTLEWKERGGPPLKPPTRTGFGRMLIEQALAQELDCTVKMNFAPEGLTCLITIPRQEYETR
jgi:PAS domain S-box-containing protein